MRIVFMGTPESAVPSLRRLLDDGHEIIAVWTQPDKPAGRGNKLHQPPVKEFALRHNLIVHQPAKIKTQEAKTLFASREADAAIVVAYGKILPTEFLGAPRNGCINVHFSLLPKYRGAAPVNWAIVKGERETGVTTMKIVEELDTGPILLQRQTAINEHETAPQLLARLAEIGAELLSETLKRFDNIQAQPQRDEEATFAPMLKREDGLIDWSMDAFAIERRVRGFQPWPNAYTTFSSRRLIIWQATAEKNDQLNGSPGQIVEAHGDNIRVACAEKTTLRLLELQIENGRRMSARDFLNGTHAKVGGMLGRV
ncbi:MAG TPA: methionyl-tRNA formyltransferase [Pyrinomonadaceae bacterium]|nr:methionyl-tRNA formyltransferase [Pyrinomonadaceae bacterium]